MVDTYAKANETRVGDILVADGGFTCLLEGEAVAVKSDDHGLYAPCAEGRHYLDGQLNEVGEYIGFRLLVGAR